MHDTKDFHARVGALSTSKRALLERLLKEKGGRVSSPPLALQRRPEGPHPASFGQERLWFVDQLEPGNSFYNVPVLVLLRGALNLVALEQALGEILRRHQALRTTFASSGGEIIQEIKPGSAIWRLPLAELELIEKEGRQPAGRRFATEDVQKPFDLGSGPLLRVWSLRFDAQDYILLINIHHIVSDHWSMGILMREMAALYEAYSMGAPSPLSELPIQFTDFAHWQRESLQGEKLERLMGYWNRRLDRASMIELPSDRPRGASQTYHSAIHPLMIPSPVAERLRALSRREGVALFVTLLAAFKALLYRYTGQEDIVVGSTIATRHRSELEELIGFFVNVLALRTEVTGALTFREILRRLRETCLGAYAHQDLPFENLVDELQPARDLSRKPLYNILFSFHNAPMPEWKLSGLKIEASPVDTGTARHDLEVWMSESAAGLGGHIEYNTDLYDEARIARLELHFQTLLKAIAEDCDRRISDLPLLTEDEHHQALVEWNQTRSEFPLTQSLSEIFEQQLALTPDALAVVFEDEHLTYRELARRTNQLANYLQSCGSGPETPVGVCLGRSAWTLIALLSVIKAGGVYVPLDSRLPVEQLSSILFDTQIKTILTEQKWLNSLPDDQAGVHVFCLDRDWSLAAKLPESAPSNVSSPENLSHIMHTSGTTGRPKGVAVPQRQLLNRFDWLWRTYAYEPGETTCHRTSASFSPSLWELLGALLKGIPTVIASDATIKDPGLLVETLASHRVTRILLVPSLLRALLESGIDLQRRLPNLKRWIAAGEPFSSDLYDRFRERLPEARLFIDYGATEMHGVAWYEPSTSEPQGSHLPIGKPIANTEIYLLDEAYRPVPIGTPGEIYVSSVGLARGYYNRPDLTAEKFVPNPFCAEAGERMYKTGDLASRLPSGNLEYRCRIDTQVKLRGIRIELRGIDETLAGHPAVRQAVTMISGIGDDDRRLISYVEPHRDCAVTIGELRRFLQTKLPEYMVPSAYVLLEALPLTLSGKIDRKALPSIEAAQFSQAKAYVPPRTPLEETLTAIFAEVLGVERVGVNENFFDMGGHSLSATRVVSRIRSLLKVEAPLRRLFEHPTVADLAECVEKLLRPGQTGRTPPMTPIPRDGEVELSFAQQRLWFINQLEPGNPAYNIPAAVRLSGRLNLGALEQSFGEVVRRHQVLRSRFTSTNGQPTQVIRQAEPFLAPVIEIGERSDTTHAVLIVEEAQRPFDLTRDSLFRVRLLRLEQNEHLLLVSMHHIISDGWSMGVFVREAAALYEAFTGGRPSPFGELPIQYADYAAWQRRWLSGEALEKELSYWKKRLAGSLQVLELPTDRPRPLVQTYRGAVHPFSLSSELSTELRAFSRQEGATMFMSLLAAFTALLHRYTAQEDIIVGSPIANRTRSETESLIGFFANILVMRTEFAGDPSFRELLGRIQEMTLGAYARQELPFEKLVKEVQPERDLSRSPLFQVVFVLQNSPQGTLKAPDLTFDLIECENGTTKFDLTLELVDDGSRLSGAFKYNTDLFAPATIARMHGHFQVLLQAAIAAPQTTISSLPLLTEPERRELSRGGNDGTLQRRRNHCIHHWIETQAERRPDAVAICCEDGAISYGILNRRANQLARRLQKMSVGAESRAAICMERSLEMVIGLLGILKVGAAYLPIEPSTPKHRRDFMLEDASACVLLTDAPMTESELEGRTPTLRLDSAWRAFGKENDADLGLEITPENLAYVIYTSGSTGLPKGVLITHSNVDRLFDATQSWFNFTEQDVWTCFHSFAFDFSVWEIWGALRYGSRLVIAPRLMTRSPEDFYRLLCEQSATVLNQTPSAFRQLVRAEESLGVSGDLSLRLVIFGGEALELQSLRPWFERRGDQRPQLVNMYGITETTVHVSYRPLTWTDVDRRSGSVIGGPIGDLQMYALDQKQQLSPIGVAGEIAVGGDGVGRGYLNRPELTASRFIPDPFSDRPGARLYRSGDLGRRLSDGDLEYLGRVDQQVKIRGFRIELGEIEAALTGYPGVLEASALARDDGFGNKQLAAYVVAALDAEIDAGDLRAYLKQRLPEYMTPSSIIMLDALPLTANGKIDRQRLPAPDQTRPDLETSYTEPRTDEEEMLAGVWAQTLGLDRVGIDDSFFALGGDSIRSIEVIARARDRGLDLSIQQLFQHQTIREIARSVKLSAAASAIPPEIPPFSLISEQDRAILPGGVEDAYPLASLQMGMLFHSEYAPDSTAYHDIFSYHLRTPLDPRALRTALQGLTANHAVLRTSFDLTNFSRPIQLVHSASAIAFQVEDLSYLDANEQEQALAQWLESEKERKFDWTRPPLIRFHIHRRTEDSFQFTLSFHHAILDGWSVAAGLTEAFQRYLALLNKEDTAAPPPAAHYRRFVALELEALSSSETQMFWREKLRDATTNPLPRWFASRQKAGVPAVRELPIAISSDVSDGLKRLARTAAVPIKSVLLAAHLRVMSLLTGDTKVLTGLTLNGRSEMTDGERVLGLFLNTLPFDQILTGGSWIDLAIAAFQTERDMLPHRRYPMARMQEDRVRQPLFDAVFGFLHFHIYEQIQSFPGFEVLGRNEFEHTNFDLMAMFSLDLSGAQIRLRLTCNARDISDEQLEAIAGYYSKTLGAMAADPASNYGSTLLLSDAERRQLLTEWNDTARDPGREESLVELFRRQAEQGADRIACRWKDEQVAYGELERRSNQLASYLRELGVRAESIVGVCLQRSPALLTGLLGVIKAGGAYLPIDPISPAQRIGLMLEDAGAQIILTEQALVAGLPQGKARLICLDDKWERIGRQSELPIDAGTTRENLAYVIYTSGSTGQPKGAMITHGGLSNYLHWARWFYEPEFGSGSVVHSSIGFDLTVTSLWTPLVSGRPVRLVEESAGVEGLAECLSSCEDYSLVKLTPSHLEALRGLLPAGELIGTSRKFVIGGEALRWEQLSHWRKHTPASRLINEYGPTETVVGCCVYEAPAAGEDTGAVPIGRPIWNTRLRLMDDFLGLTAVGSVGELYIAGAGVARGYLNRPELTAERFTPDPYSACGGERLYRSGDLCRYYADGELEYLGRRDGQVKMRGYRVELGEIEAALRRHPEISDAVVRTVGDASPGKRLAAYLVARSPNRPSPADLNRCLQQFLPDYMVPSAYMWLEKIPLTSNGKVDARLLPNPQDAQTNSRTVYVAPRNPIEKELARIWAEVLRVEQVGVYDNFFELGGDSILGIQALARANQAGIKLTPKQLFQAPRISELGKLAGAANASETEQGAVTGEAPLTPIQRWFFEQEPPEPQHFNQALLLQTDGLQAGLLRRALGNLLAQHDALRLCYESGEKEWRQRHREFREPELLVEVELGGLSADSAPSAIEDVCRQVQQSLNLGQGPLLRAALLQTNGSQRLLLVAHHLVIDGVSWRILLADLQRAYIQLRQGGPADLGAKTTSFRQWAQRLVEYAQSPIVLQQLDYWTEQTAVGVGSIPVDFPGGENLAGWSRSITIELNPAETATLLTEAPRAHGIRIDEALLTALIQALNQWNGCTEQLVEVEGHGREELFEDVDLTRTIGWFTSLFPVRLRLERGLEVGESLRRIGKQVRSAPQRGVGYGLLRYLTQDPSIERLKAGRPSEVSFNYLGQFDSALESAGGLIPAMENSGPTRNPRGRRKHLLEISGAVLGGKLQLLLHYSEKIHRRETIEGLAVNFREHLRQIVAYCRSAEDSQAEFPLATLDRRTVKSIVERNPAAEDLYPLSPMQQGILFHSLYSPESGLYVTQVKLELRGAIDASAFEQAWQEAVNRRTILRTSFVWEGLEEPHQIVHVHVRAPFELHDWSALPVEEQRDRLSSFWKEDRARGFNLKERPLIRASLARLAEDVHQFTCTFHHLVMDGWSGPLVLKDLFGSYDAVSKGRPYLEERSLPYREYIDWLQRQSLPAAETFWRRALKGFTVPTPLEMGVAEASPDDDQSPGEEHVQLPVATTVALQALVRGRSLTFNTLMQGAWALLVSYHSKQYDVVFGATVAGRPATAPGVESIVGPFINTLPLRAQLPPDEIFLSWIQTLQRQQIEAREYEYSPLVEVHGWSDVPRGVPLFESLLVFENYPLDSISATWKGELEIVGVSASIMNNYPLTLRVVPVPSVSLQALYERRRFGRAVIQQMLRRLQSLLSGIVRNPDATIDELLQSLADDDRDREERQEFEFKESRRRKLRSFQPRGRSAADAEAPSPAQPSVLTKLNDRKAVKVTNESLIHTEFLDPTKEIPLVVKPAIEGVDLTRWCMNHRDFLDANLLKYGAILFRNFNVKSAVQFEQFIKAVSGELMEYSYRSTPRSQVSGDIYTSTEYPANETIPLHNENAYTSSWPAKIWFFCLEPAEQGGETPIADSRQVYQSIDPAIRERFERKQVLYVRNYGEGLDLSWQTVFQTTDRAQVEEYCCKASIEIEWKGNDSVRTRQVCQSVAAHPKTGEKVWFNQAHLFHVSCLRAEVSDFLRSVFKEEELPRNAYYGDGEPIDAQAIDEINEAYRRSSVVFPWQRGDILMLDNMLAAHGRMPYTGPRKILVGMAEPLGLSDLKPETN
jgi:amino acid adenylation domain-containing protein/non-ribosomal peptide synthase protein (TIGR01720 family)